MKNFYFTKKPINPEVYKREVSNVNAGGYVSFEGWVRCVNQNKNVSYLYYEIYSELAEKELMKIFNEMEEKFPIINMGVCHRIGEVKLGEIAVWIGIACKHRAPAFLACEYAINNIKKRVPIWKNEFYIDGTSSWVTCCAES